MKGVLSLDFVVSMIVVMLLASAIITFAYFQQEKIVESQFKINAELLATDIGSSINRAYAITDDSDNITLRISPHDIDKLSSFTGILVSSSDCRYNITNGVVYVTITYSFSGTGRSGKVVGSYPIFLDKSLQSGQSRSCDESFELVHKLNSNWVIE